MVRAWKKGEGKRKRGIVGKKDEERRRMKGFKTQRETEGNEGREKESGFGRKKKDRRAREKERKYKEVERKRGRMRVVRIWGERIKNVEEGGTGVLGQRVMEWKGEG